MPKFKTLNNQIPGLIRHCSPIRNENRKGVAYRYSGEISMREIYKDYLDVIPSVRRNDWTLDLRDLTGAFHAAQYVSDNFDKLEAHGVGSAHDFETVLGDGSADSRANSVYYGAYVGAGQGDLLTPKERKALAKIVLWVAERVG